jgi:hypothetical protein
LAENNRPLNNKARKNTSASKESHFLRIHLQPAAVQFLREKDFDFVGGRLTAHKTVY